MLLARALLVMQGLNTSLLNFRGSLMIDNSIVGPKTLF